MNINDLLGRTLVAVARVGDDEIHFTADDGERFKLYHAQDCCEHVSIEDVTGNLSDLIGSPITMADESSNQQDVGKWGDSQTWTFYKLATLKGYVDIRWLGTSNGYYSEHVDFTRVSP